MRTRRDSRVSPNTTFEDIGYALTALVDEVIMLKGGQIRDFWAAKMLQLELFNEATAGQGLFDRAAGLAHADPSRMQRCFKSTTSFCSLAFKASTACAGWRNRARRSHRPRAGRRSAAAVFTKKETVLSPHGASTGLAS